MSNRGIRSIRSGSSSGCESTAPQESRRRREEGPDPSDRFRRTSFQLWTIPAFHPQWPGSAFLPDHSLPRSPERKDVPCWLLHRCRSRRPRDRSNGPCPDSVSSTRSILGSNFPSASESLQNFPLRLISLLDHPPRFPSEVFRCSN